MIELPDPIKPFPHEDKYQYQFAEVPRKPPETFKPEDSPGQIVVGDAETEDRVVEKSSTIIVVFTQFVVLHKPSALT